MSATHEKEPDFIHQPQRAQCQVPATPLQEVGHPVLAPLFLWVSPRGQNLGYALKGEGRGQRRGEIGYPSPSRPTAFQTQMVERAGWKWGESVISTGLDILISEIRLFWVSQVTI